MIENSEGQEPSAADRLLPDAAKVFQWRPRPTRELSEDALVALDTNVLAVPYTVSRTSLDAIAGLYRRLRDQGRLRIPGQVAREFAGVREKKLAELQQQIFNHSSKVTKPGRVGKYPLLSGRPQYEAMLEYESTLSQMIDQYQSSVRSVVAEVQAWSWDDPVSAHYQEAFPPSVVVDYHYAEVEVKADATKRKAAGMPPGYKDAGKDDGGIGDLLIWRTLLEIGRKEQRDVLFVTEDEKSDWRHGGSGNTRFELLQEFRRETGGRTIAVISLKAFLQLSGVDEQVVDEVVTTTGTAVPGDRNAEWIRDGSITVVRTDSYYGAFKPLQQTSTEADGTIEYQWWYQPNGSGLFLGPSVITGYGAASETGDTDRNLRIGPWSIQWSKSGPGTGWVYYAAPGLEFQFAVTNFSTVHELGDATKLTFTRRVLT